MPLSSFIEDRREDFLYPIEPEYRADNYFPKNSRWSGLDKLYEYAIAHPDLYSREEIDSILKAVWRDRQARGIEQSQRLGLSEPDLPTTPSPATTGLWASDQRTGWDPRNRGDDEATISQTRETFPGLVRGLPERSAPVPPIMDSPMQRFSGDEEEPSAFASFLEDDPDEEDGFREWYADHASRLGLNPNPDDPRHHYDYRAAYRAGAVPDESGHWPSQFKSSDHPNRYVDGVDTISGESVLDRLLHKKTEGDAQWARIEESDGSDYHGVSGDFLRGVGRTVTNPETYRQGLQPWVDVGTDMARGVMQADRAAAGIAEAGGAAIQKLGKYFEDVERQHFEAADVDPSLPSIGGAARRGGDALGGAVRGSMKGKKEYLAKEIAEGPYRRSENFPEDFWKGMRERPVETLARHSAENLATLVLTIGTATVGAAAAGPVAGGAAALGMAGVQEGGAAWNEAKESGASDAEALRHTGISAVASSVLEATPVGIMFRRLGAPTGDALRMVRGALEQGMAEGTTETLQDFVKMVSERLTFAEGKGWGWEEVKQLGQSFLIGFTLGTPTGAATPAPLDTSIAKTDDPGAVIDDALISMAAQSLALEGPVDNSVEPILIEGEVTVSPPSGKNKKVLVARDATGAELGSIIVTPTEGGYQTDWVEVYPEYRRQGVGEALQGEAQRLFGERLEPAVGTTPEGAALAAALAPVGAPETGIDPRIRWIAAEVKAESAVRPDARESTIDKIVREKYARAFAEPLDDVRLALGRDALVENPLIVGPELPALEPGPRPAADLAGGIYPVADPELLDPARPPLLREGVIPRLLRGEPAAPGLARGYSLRDTSRLLVPGAQLPASMVEAAGGDPALLRDRSSQRDLLRPQSPFEALKLRLPDAVPAPAIHARAVLDSQVAGVPVPDDQVIALVSSAEGYNALRTLAKQEYPSRVYMDVLNRADALYQERNPAPIDRAGILKRYFTKEGEWHNFGPLAKPYSMSKLSSDARILGAALQADEVAHDFTIELKRAIRDTGKSEDELLGIVDRALDSGELELLGEGETLRNVPLGLVGAASRMRRGIDTWTQKLMSTDGLIPDATKETLGANLGQYLRTMYRVHFDPEAQAKLVLKDHPEIFQAAYDGMRAMRDEGVLPWADDQKIDSYLRGLLVRDPANFFAATDTMVQRLDRGIFKHKKEMPDFMKSLLGEISDPRTRYLESVARMSFDYETWNFQQELAETGRNIVFFDEQTGDFNQKIGGEGTRTPLAGLYTTPTIKATVDGIVKGAIENHGVAHIMLDGYLRANGLIKANMTAYNPSTHGRNILAYVAMSLQLGHSVMIPARVAKELGRMGANRLKELAQTNSSAAIDAEIENVAIKSGLAKSTEEWRRMLRRATELGVAGQSVRAGEVTRYSEQMTRGATALSEAFIPGIQRRRATSEGSDKKVLGGVLGGLVGGARASGRLVKKAVDGGAYLYGREDDLGRMAIWEAETQSMMKVYPEMTREQAEEAAAETINEITPTWNRAWKAAEILRLNPIFGMFPTFHMERLRNNANLMLMISRELRSDNPRLRALGARRAAGYATTLAMAPVARAVKMSKWLMPLGVGLGIDDEEWEALRNFGAPWERNSDRIPIGLSEDRTKFEFFDMSFMDPDSPFKDALRAVVFGLEDPRVSVGRAFWDGAKEFLGVFAGPESLPTLIIDLARNQRETGSQIYNPEEGVIQNTADMTYEAARRIGGPVRAADNMRIALTSGMDQYGNIKEPWQEAITLAGPRLRQVHIPTATKLGDARRLSERYQSTRRIFRDQAMDMRNLDIKLPSVNPVKRDPENPLSSYMTKAEQSWVDVYQDLVQKMRGRIALGHGAGMVKGDFMAATPSLPKAVVSRAWNDAKSDTPLLKIEPPKLFTKKDLDAIEASRSGRAKERGIE